MMTIYSLCRISKLALAAMLVNICMIVNAACQSDAPTCDDSAVERADTDALMSVGMPQGTVSQVVDYPGFRVSFNADCHQPNWVAWELTGAESLANTANRKQAKFLPDESVRGCAQLADYKGSGFERGHMCPAGDMKWSVDAMNACFLLTNICPQTQQLNGGAWNSLENKCREWAVRDSAIIVVCGPVLNDVITRHIGASSVAVPERFFKVILAPYCNPPRAIGFIMNNGYVQGGMQASAVSVDQVEDVTGYDFFSCLPNEIETAVESQCNFPQWSQP